MVSAFVYVVRRAPTTDCDSLLAVLRLDGGTRKVLDVTSSFRFSDSETDAFLAGHDFGKDTILKLSAKVGG